MINHRHLLILVLLILAVTAPLRALEWDRTQISATAERGADVVRTKFEFKNTAKNPVHILGVTTSCGCTEATPTSSNIAPGERGALEVLFTVGARTGLQEKEITVLTDDSRVPIKLRLKITIPTDAPAIPPNKS